MAGPLYKWVDENGNISYQDQPPPSGAAVSQEVLKQPSSLTADDAAAGSLRPDQINPVVVYTVDACDACELLLLRLKQLGVPNQEQSLMQRDIQARVLSLTDGLTAPTVFIGNKIVLDTSEANLTAELKAAGYLLTESAPDFTDDNSPQDIDDAEEIPQTNSDE